MGGGGLENSQPVPVRRLLMNADGEKSLSLRERRAVWLFVFRGKMRRRRGRLEDTACVVDGCVGGTSTQLLLFFPADGKKKIKRFHFHAETLCLKELLNFSSVLVLLDLLEQAAALFYRGQRAAATSIQPQFSTFLATEFEESQQELH